MVKHSTKVVALASGTYPTNPTASFSGVQTLPSWSAAVTIAGTAVMKVEAFDVTLTRENTEAVPALTGGQDPYTVFQGAAKTTGKFTAVTEDDTILTYYAGQYPTTQPAVVIAASVGSGSSTVGIAVQMTKCGITDVKRVGSGKPYVADECTFEGVANTTDGTPGGGAAPCLVKLSNNVSTAVYV